MRQSRLKAWSERLERNLNTSGSLTTENEGAIIKNKNLSLWPTTQTRDYPVPPPCRQGRQEGGPIGVREPVCEGFIVTLRYRFNSKRNKILARVRRAQAVRLLTGRWRSSPHLGSVKLGLCGWWRSILTLDFPIPGAFKKKQHFIRS